MECPKCGAKITDEKICLRCGNTLDTKIVDQIADEVLEENEAHYKGEVSRYRGSILFYIVSILLFLPVSLYLFDLISNDNNRFTLAIIYVIIIINVYSFLFVRFFRSINDVMYLHYKHTDSGIKKLILFALGMGVLVLGFIVRYMK